MVYCAFILVRVQGKVAKGAKYHLVMFQLIIFPLLKSFVPPLSGEEF